MSAPYGNIRSKLSRAMAAYLISLTNASIGTANDIFPQFSEAQKSYPNTVCRTVQGTPEPPLSGDYICKVQIHVRGSATPPTGTTDLNSIRATFDARVAATHDAFMVTDALGVNLDATAVAITIAGRALAVSDPTNNADMVDFTLIMWNDAGFAEGQPDDQGTAWEEVFVFEALACGYNVS